MDKSPENFSSPSFSNPAPDIRVAAKPRGQSRRSSTRTRCSEARTLQEFSKLGILWRGELYRNVESAPDGSVQRVWGVRCRYDQTHRNRVIEFLQQRDHNTVQFPHVVERPRVRPIASNSSRSSTQGVPSAKRNRARRLAPVCPRYAPTTLLNRTVKTGRSNILPRLRAERVLPQPGGPKNRAFVLRLRFSFASSERYVHSATSSSRSRLARLVKTTSSREGPGSSRINA